MSKTKKQAERSLDNVKSLMAERAELHMEKKEIEAEIKELDEVLRPMLEGKGKVIYNGFQHEVSMQSRKSFNRKAAESFITDHGGKVEDFIEQGAPYTVYKISEVQQL